MLELGHRGAEMIQLSNVSKYYRVKNDRHYVLDNVSVSFPPNTSIGILGRNGAGKSTLLRMLGGMEYPNKGKVKVSGSISWPVGLSSGFQGSLTARENIKFVCQIFGKSITERNEIVHYVQDFAEIGKHFDMPIKTYSSGMKGRVNFGLSMAFDFDYYLVDEVTGVGDKRFKEKAKAAFDEKRKNASVIMVSHDMNSLRQNCDMGIYLKGDGQLSIYDDIEIAIKKYSSNGK